MFWITLNYVPTLPREIVPPKTGILPPRINFKGVGGTTFALPSSHQKATPLQYEILSPHTFSPRGDNFKGVGGGGTITRGRVDTSTKKLLHILSILLNRRYMPKKEELMVWRLNRFPVFLPCFYQLSLRKGGFQMLEKFRFFRW